LKTPVPSCASSRLMTSEWTSGARMSGSSSEARRMSPSLALGGGIGGCGGAGPKEVARAVGHGADGGAEEKSVGAECGPDTNQ
jgi:hypothetical protein